MAPILEIAKVMKRFGGIVALQGVDLEVGSDEIVGLIGPNGSGKTTLINVVTGLIPATSGSVSLQGRVISGCKPHQICQRGVSRTYQVPRFFSSMSCLDNVRVIRKFNRMDSAARNNTSSPCKVGLSGIELLELVRLSHKANSPAQGLSLSELRKLELAMCLASRPEVMLIDELMAGLDQRECAELVGVIGMIRSHHIAMVWVEHNIGLLVEVAQRIAVLNNGVKLAEGSPAEVTCDYRVREAYLGTQL